MTRLARDILRSLAPRSRPRSKRAEKRTTSADLVRPSTTQPQPSTVCGSPPLVFAFYLLSQSSIPHDTHVVSPDNAEMRRSDEPEITSPAHESDAGSDDDEPMTLVYPDEDELVPQRGLPEPPRPRPSVTGLRVVTGKVRYFHYFSMLAQYDIHASSATGAEQKGRSASTHRTR